MCGGWLGETLSDVGKAVEENVTKPVVGAVKDVGEFIEEEVIDPVKEFGSSLEDAVRDAADDVNKVIENPYVQMIVTAINPAAGAVLSAYATVNSGDELSAGQIAALATAGITQANVNISPNVQKAINAGATVADGGSVEDALLNAYGKDFAKELGLDTKVQSGLANIVGEDVATSITNTIDVNKASADLVAGNSPERILANQFGDDIVNYLGAESPSQRALGFAGIETAVKKAEGATDQQALLSGARTYYNQGGQLPDIGQIASLTGIEDFDLGLNDFISDLDIDFPELKGLGYDLPSLSSLGVNLPDLSGIEVPDLLSSFNLPEVAGLGFDIPSLDLSGFKPTDLGFDIGTWGQLRDLGINIGDLDLSDYNLDALADINLDLQLPELDMYLRNQGIAPMEFASLEMDRDLLPEFSITPLEEEEEIPLSERLLTAKLT